MCSQQSTIFPVKALVKKKGYVTTFISFNITCLKTIYNKKTYGLSKMGPYKLDLYAVVNT